jgi:hypothetical protein
MEITNFEELFTAVKLIHDKNRNVDELEMFSERSFCFYDGDGFEFVVLVNYYPTCRVKHTYSLRIGEKRFESKDPKRIYDLAKAIIKCED